LTALFFTPNLLHAQASSSAVAAAAVATTRRPQQQQQQQQQQQLSGMSPCDVETLKRCLEQNKGDHKKVCDRVRGVCAPGSRREACQKQQQQTQRAAAQTFTPSPPPPPPHPLLPSV
jgi:hypothetical protein